MSDIFEETEEDLRAQKWVEIVKKGAPWVGAFLVAALLLALASWGWQTWQDKVRDTASETFQAAMDASDVKVKSGVYRGEEGTMSRMRWVTHLDVSRKDVERAIKAAASF